MSQQKHEMLFQRFNINYNAIPSRYRKGSVLVREPVRHASLFCVWLLVDTFYDSGLEHE